MDFMAKINELRAKKSDLLQKVDALTEAGNTEELEKVSSQMEDYNRQIQALEKLASASAARAEPMDGGDPGDPSNGGGDPGAKKPKVTPFASLGEQLQAVVKAAKTHEVDKRLLEVNNAIQGANETTGADGGFAVQEDFAGMILETAVQTGQILSRVDSYTVGANSNAAKWLMVDETDVSASVFGGVQMYWASEGATVLASRPKFKEMKLDLEKMMGFAYATDELLQDAPFMTGFFGRAFAVATDLLLEDGVVAGDGNGKMLGFLKSKSLITVGKETGQAAGTLTAENILNMWQRALVKGRSDSVWLIHPDLESQLPKLKLCDDLIWMPEGGLSGGMYQTILGRPVIFTDSMMAQGSEGDVALVNLKEYMLLRKGTAKQDWSMHVEFLTDQMCFRIVLRCNGAPKRSAPVKIRHSSQTRSPFVTLAART